MLTGRPGISFRREFIAQFVIECYVTVFFCNDFRKSLTELQKNPPQLSCKYHQYLCSEVLDSGPGSVVGIATAYGLDGRGSNPGGRRDFPHLSRPALRPTQPPVQWVPGISRGVRCCRGVTLTPHPLLVQRSKIE